MSSFSDRVDIEADGQSSTEIKLVLRWIHCWPSQVRSFECLPLPFKVHLGFTCALSSIIVKVNDFTCQLPIYEAVYTGYCFYSPMNI